jgi:hypothetical protein
MTKNVFFGLTMRNVGLIMHLSYANHLEVQQNEIYADKMQFSPRFRIFSLTLLVQQKTLLVRRLYKFIYKFDSGHGTHLAIFVFFRAVMHDGFL